MKKIFSAVLVLLVAGVGSAQQPQFVVTPGFDIQPNGLKAAPCCECGPGCGCPVGVCPGGCQTPDQTWFACRVVVSNGDGTGNAGSGTPVHCEGGKTTVLTNAHVVPKGDAHKPIHVYVGGRKFKARYIDGSEVIQVDATTIKTLGPDLALLEVDAELGHVEIADEAPSVGSQVWQFGYGGTRFDEGPTVKGGLVREHKYAVPMLSSSLPSVSGDSGSGLFNTRGELCGVTYGGSATLGNYAIETGTVRSFMGRPLLAKLFPKMASRMQSRREARAAANLPPPMQAPPSVERKGPVDPKLAKPAEGAPKPKAPTVAPFGSGTPPKPAGEGWQYDPVRKTWWKWETPKGFSSPAPPVAPAPSAKPGSFNVVPGDCPNGLCPKQQPQQLFRYIR